MRSCMQHVSGKALKDIFLLTYDRMRRYQGAWHLEQQPMFPHYLFLESENGEQLLEELAEYEDFVTVFREKDYLIPVHREEEQFLRGICGNSHHLSMSRGYIRNGQTCVTEGPLRGREGLIRKIDRHKRLARLSMPGGSGLKEELREMYAGLEIVAKS